MVFVNGMKRLLLVLIIFGALAVNLVEIGSGVVIADDKLAGEIPPSEVEVVNPYFTIERITLDDGTKLEKNIINGPPEPSSKFEEARMASIQPITTDSVITNFPSYDWVFGCSAVSGAMIAAYYDRNGYPNMYTGPTNGGVMPLTDTSWPTWYSSEPDPYDPYPNNPLVASHNGMDGRNSRGTIDDYWVSYGSGADDPYITGNWAQHSWSNAIGDFMKTSRSVYGYPDGSTIFYTWSSKTDPLTCSDMENINIDHLDGTYGRKLFYEARGYSVDDCYNQETDTQVVGGFSLADFQAEIDAGRPVLLNLTGHSVVGYGYSGSTIYIRDTWSSDPSYTPMMDWYGNYGDGMVLQSVSIVHLDSITLPPSIPDGVNATDGNYTDKVSISWNASNGATHYKVFRNTSGSHTGETEITSNHNSSPFDDLDVTPGVDYYYWIQACNSGGCSDYSNADLGFAAETIPSPPTGIFASDGFFTDQVLISWHTSSGATYYKVYKNTRDNHTGETLITNSHTSTSYNDNDVDQDQTYYYWVEACNSKGCSDYSPGDSGYAASEVSINQFYLPLIRK